MCKSFEEPLPLERSQGCKHSFCDHMLNFIGSQITFDFPFFFSSSFSGQLSWPTFGGLHGGPLEWDTMLPSSGGLLLLHQYLQCAECRTKPVLKMEECVENMAILCIFCLLHIPGRVNQNCEKFPFVASQKALGLCSTYISSRVVTVIESSEITLLSSPSEHVDGASVLTGASEQRA